MKKKTLIIIAILIIVPTAVLFLISLFVQPLLPQPWNSALILLGVVLAAVLAGLSGVDKAIQIADRIDPPEEAVVKETKTVAESSSGGLSVIADESIVVVTQYASSGFWEQFPKTSAAQVEAEAEKAELLDAVARNQEVRRLASNPLLLTILALMKRQGVSLPERRVELYEQYVRVLLKHWNLARGLDRPPARDLDVVETVRVLAPLALWMHETSSGRSGWRSGCRYLARRRYPGL